MQDMEDGVLRGNSPAAASLGMLLGIPKLSSGPFDESDPRRRLAVVPMDPRIHFALVCGAKSCPPIKVRDSLCCPHFRRAFSSGRLNTGV